jgi:amidase
MPFFKQEILEASDKRQGLDNKEYKEALAKTSSARRIIDNIMKKNQLDAIAGTSIGPACCIDLVNGDYDTGFYFCTPAAMAGYPHITIPMGTLHDLPLGFSFAAGAYQEPIILGFAYAFEQASKKRVMPKFIKNLVN